MTKPPHNDLSRRERRVRLPVQRQEQILEIDPADQHADGRHDDVVDERGDDLAERGTDDDPDRQVDDVAAGGELSEFL